MSADGRVARVWLVVSFLCSAALSVSASAGPAPCAAEVSLVPQRAIVGQQVLYRVRILRRADVPRVGWVRPPAFPDLRAEWLPGHAEDTETMRDGAVYHVREDHRALFAPWAGPIVLPAFELRCALASGEVATAEVPSVALQVQAPPSAGRPADFAGVIGPLQVQVSTESRAISLGESVRVSVQVRGDSNLWDMRPPLLDAERESELEIHRGRPELDLEAGARLYVRRYFRLDLVPRRAGILTIPAVEVPHYDAEAGDYRVARSHPIEIRVTTPATSQVNPAQKDELSATDANAPREPVAGSATALLAGAVIVSAAVGTAVALRRRFVWQEVDRALVDAERARELGDPIRESAALVEALEAARTRARPSRVAAQRARLDEIFTQLDLARFAGRGASPPRDRARSLITELR